MTDDLSPRARALLDAARDGLGPDDAVLARVRDRVIAGGAAGAAGAAAASASTGGGIAGKLAIVGIVAAIGGGVWLGLGLGRAGEPAPAASAPELAAPVETSTTSRFEAAAPTAPPPSASPLPSAPAAARRAVPVTAPSLADEVAVVDAAMAALRAGDLQAALAATDRHSATFGERGQLAEEAAALRVEALCRLGDDRADAGWDAFLVRWPTSAQQPRIAAACKEPRR